MNNFSIYVHLPFCQKRCIYCDFASFISDKKKQAEYVDFLVKEILASKYTGKARSIYFGGGTPSIFSTQQIAKIFNAIKSKFLISDDIEKTIECNPCSVTLEKLKFYKNLGFNRISFGVQSLNDDLLKFLGRLHDKNMAKEAILLAKQAGFTNISADLLIGIPGQSEEDLIKSAAELLELSVTHISAYMLQIEDNTPLKNMILKHEVKPPCDDFYAELYKKIVDFLKKHNFKRYEVSNFAKKGFESRHNFCYWKRQNYLGFGLSAHSFVSNLRFFNPSNFTDYYAGKKTYEKLSSDEIISEIIMLGLRCNYGVSIKKLNKLGYNILNNKNYQLFTQKNIIFRKNNRFYLNPDYFNVSSDIIVKLLP